jgi:hypothetical protein
MQHHDPIHALDLALTEAREALRSLGLDPRTAPAEPYGGRLPRIVQDGAADPRDPEGAPSAQGQERGREAA